MDENAGKTLRDLEVSALAKEKANDYINKQKIYQINESLMELVKTIPNSLKELRRAIELLDNQIDNVQNISTTSHEKLQKTVNRMNHEIDTLFEKIREIKDHDTNDKIDNLTNKLINKNNDNSLVMEMKKMFHDNHKDLVDMNNERSLLYHIKKILNTKTAVTWIITSLLTILMIIEILSRTL